MSSPTERTLTLAALEPLSPGIDAAAFVTGCAGPVLTDDEIRFIADARPFGLILFRRNVENRDQLRGLVAEFRSAVGWHAPVLVDQEGGRVQRLTAPEWKRRPSAGRLAAAARVGRDAPDVNLARIAARLIAADLASLGITVACMPVLDLRLSGASDIVGDRSYSGDPGEVALFGRAAVEGLCTGGIIPLVKHVPGHGRALVDSHLGLPVVDAPRALLSATDFLPFGRLADLPMAMTAHVVYTAIDPDRPATLSPLVIGDVIRGEIGFDGLLFSDDLSMGALSGSLAERAAGALRAGCDIALHCSGAMAEMIGVAVAAPRLDGRALERAAAALRWRCDPDGASLDALEGELAHALGRLDAAVA